MESVIDCAPDYAQATEKLFGNKLELPVNENLLHAAKHSKWSRIPKTHDYRKWQAKNFGLMGAGSYKGLVTALYGAVPTSSLYQPAVNYDRVYNHHTKKIEKKKWKMEPTIFSLDEDCGLFTWPPFKRNKIWSCRFSALNDAKCEIPPEVMVKLLRLQKLNLFTVFNIIEPIFPNSNSSKSLIGSIWELSYYSTYGEQTRTFNHGAMYHYFLTAWQ